MLNRAPRGRRLPRKFFPWPEKIEIGQLYWNWKFEGTCFIGLFRADGMTHCFRFKERADAASFRSQAPIVAWAKMHTWDEGLLWLKLQHQ